MSAKQWYEWTDEEWQRRVAIHRRNLNRSLWSLPMAVTGTGLALADYLAGDRRLLFFGGLCIIGVIGWWGILTEESYDE